MRTKVVNALILTINSEQEIIPNGCMIFEDESIIFIGSEPTKNMDFDRIIDAKGNIVMPGFINTHCHSPMTLLRGYADDLTLLDWLNKIWPIEKQFTEKEIRWGSQLAIVEMLKNGITTFSDMYIFMDIVAETVKQTGIRANLSRSIIETSNNENENNDKLVDATRFTKEWNNQADGRIKTMMAPHSIYTCSAEYIKKISAVANELNVPIQTHLAETDYEVKRCFVDYGCSPVRHLENLGVFNNQTLIAHAVFVDKDDIEIFVGNKVKISHNPGSNLKLGSGIAPIPDMIKKGLHVSLGTDGAASNNNLNIIEEMRLAALIHKGVNNNPKLISANEAILMSTYYGAESLFIADSVGSLEVGKKADFIIIDINQAHLYPMYNPISQLVYSASGRDIKDVFINGFQVVQDRKILTIDEEETYFEMKKITNKWM